MNAIPATRYIIIEIGMMVAASIALMIGVEHIAARVFKANCLIPCSASYLVLAHVRSASLGSVIPMIACELFDSEAVSLAGELTNFCFGALFIIMKLIRVILAVFITLLAAFLVPLLLVLHLELAALLPVLLTVSNALLKALSNSDCALRVLDVGAQLADLFLDIELGIVHRGLLLLEFLLLGMELQSLTLNLLRVFDLFQLALLLFLVSLHLELFALNSGLTFGLVTFLGALAEFVLQFVGLSDLLGDLIVNLLLVITEALQSIFDLLEVLFKLLLLVLKLFKVVLLIFGAAGPFLISETTVASILNGIFSPVRILKIFHIEVLVDDLVFKLLVFFILITFFRQSRRTLERDSFLLGLNFFIIYFIRFPDRSLNGFRGGVGSRFGILRLVLLFGKGENLLQEADSVGPDLRLDAVYS